LIELGDEVLVTYKRGSEKNASIVKLDFDWEVVK